MKLEILKCPKCNKYTLKKLCIDCKINTLSPKPAKFSLEDKYLKYRLISKKNELRNKTI